MIDLYPFARLLFAISPIIVLIFIIGTIYSLICPSPHGDEEK